VNECKPLVTGETNTDDLSPAPDAWSRPDIPLHAQAMFKVRSALHDVHVIHHKP
jgi:aconitase B